MYRLAMTLCFLAAFFVPNWALPADVVPNEVQMPGTQPLEIGNLESPNKCDNCHGGYNSAVEPAHNWRGSMMAQAGRDPIFWATLAVAEQDFDGAGDLCLRCHSTGGWLAGRSTPTDGSGLAAGDSDGVECDYCHKLTNPDDSEHQGLMNAPFLANDENYPAPEGYYGSGMSSMWDGSDKLGPYLNADARHQFMRSQFHRKSEFCGTCHDVSNPVVGDLAPNAGSLADPHQVINSEALSSDVDLKAAFNNLPYRYGIVERTFSEHMSSALPTKKVDAYDTLPQGGAFQAVRDATHDPARGTANYEDGTVRYYTCQTCHLRAVTGAGADKRGVLVRSDLPLHDMTGGNYLMPELIKYLDAQGKLRLGGGLSSSELQALDDGKLRAQEQLQLAATLEVEGDTVTVVNHTGHKLITGYPEGRRMWLNITWYDANGYMDGEEIGAYGPIEVADPRSPNSTIWVPSLLNPVDGAAVYEAHMGMTQEWANALASLNANVYADIPLSYDRITGDTEMTLGQLAGDEAGTAHETFHFALNNTVIKDNRIPPYGMRKDVALERNAAPVPHYEYDDIGGVYEHFDTVTLTPPTGATSATISLMYEPTSWEYVQFLYLANRRQNAFLAEEGVNMLEAWLWAVDNGLAEPYAMASTTWTASGSDPGGEPDCNLEAPATLSAEPADKSVALAWSSVTAASGYTLYYDQADKAQAVVTLNCADCLSYTDSGLTNDQTYCYKVTALDGSCESGFSDIACATPQNAGQQTTDEAGAQFTPDGIGYYETTGKGKNAETQWKPTTDILPGEEVVIRLEILDSSGNPVPNAIVTLAITGPESLNLDSDPSGADGRVEVRWQTSAPNKKGHGGTASGDYLATVVNVDATGYAWDGNHHAQGFTILQ